MQNSSKYSTFLVLNHAILLNRLEKKNINKISMHAELTFAVQFSVLSSVTLTPGFRSALWQNKVRVPYIL